MFASKKTTVVAATIAGLLALSACSQDSNETANPTGENTTGPQLELVTDGVLTVCSNAPFKPFEYEGEDGNLTGIDIDLTKLAAEELGLEFQAIQYDFDAMSSGAAFEAGSCDVLATGMTITAERQAKFDFSDPYYDANQGVLVADGLTISSLDELAGKTIAVQAETTGKTVAEEAGLDVAEFPEVGSVVQSVATKQYDAAVADLGVLQAYLADGLSIAYTENTNEQYGFGVKKGNTAIVEALNTTIKNAKDSGEYDEIITKHVGAEDN
ncbi:transporter substrate-binding domain-containing protein [Populibacterium corticicola]|uniref:Transporter substrate-binding domain-containing protein n=1 Tax=Populibacterium corticicola TaxID=1812826 RepID=A0ABW5XF32_9MICO